jgi:hypothetical protein
MGQWALKYWPSNRDRVNDKISISPDYDGTVLAKLLCPGFATPGCTPAIARTYPPHIHPSPHNIIH